jgi:DNA-binding SARP family transcriptional activator
VRFRLLGPLRVRRGEDWMGVPAGQQRVLLAVLLAEAGRTVAVDRLVDEIWGERPPRGAQSTLHGYVFRLRRLIGGSPAGPLASRPGGYELVVSDDDLDAAAFDRLVDTARRELAGGRVEPAASLLSRALDLWRGPALADVAPSPTVVAETARLEQLRLRAAEFRLDAWLELGRHADVAVEASRIALAHPLHEPVWEHLVASLSRLGRRGEALDAYQQARKAMVTALGLEPGARLRGLQQAILAEDQPEASAGPPAMSPPVPPDVVPAQLPPGVAGFTGRQVELKQLDALLPAVTDPAGTAVVIATVAGTAGVGKTALAVHWARQVAARFGDGQLYVNLRGHADVPPVQPVEALARFLRALGVPREQVPSDVDEASATYRSLLAGKRVLVLLDNARDAEQVRPLLPGSPGCLAVVTSRDRLSGLVARDGAIPLTLDVFSTHESQELLARLLGSDRIGLEPDAAAELTRLCGNLPLALRIVAADLARRARTSIAEYTTRLSGDRLGGLEIDGDPDAGVRGAFDLSYAALPQPARALFRRLGLVPGPDITAPGAAALAGGSPAEAARLLDRLHAAHLVEEHAAGRYTMHDLLRGYAAERAVAEDPETERLAALDGLYEHFQDHVDAAADMLYPEMLRLPTASPSPIRFDNEAGASAWLDDERPNLVAAVVHTARQGPRPVAWRLADALRGYFLHAMSIVDWKVIVEAGLVAADAAGDDHALAAGYLSRGLMHSMSNRGDEAIDCYLRATASAQRAGWPEAEAAALGNIGSQHMNMGQYVAAADYHARALASRKRLGWQAGEATAMYNLGLTYFGLGRLELAAEQQAGAAAINRRLGATVALARVNAALGVVHHLLGRFDDAMATLAPALAVLRNAGDRYYAAYAQCGLADLHRDLGNHAQALDLAESATAIAREFSDRSLEATAVAASASAHHHLGDRRKALSGYERALELAHESTDRPLVVEVLVRLADIHHGAGRPDLAADLAKQGLALARACRYRLVEGRALTVLAMLHLGQGDLTAAIDHAEHALRVHTETGHRLAGQALRRAGDDAAARHHEDAAQALFADVGGRSTGPGPHGYQSADSRAGPVD